MPALLPRCGRAIRLAALCGLLAASAAHAQVPPAGDPARPGASGVETRPFASETRLVANAPMHFVLALPADWSAHSDGTSTLFEPATSNPGDLGALVLLEASASLATPERALEVLAEVLVEPRETAREPITIRADGQPIEATLLSLEARLGSERPARLLVLHAVHGELAVLAFAGASEEVWGPWDATLRDLLLSLELNTGAAATSR